LRPDLEIVSYWVPAAAEQIDDPPGLTRRTSQRGGQIPDRGPAEQHRFRLLKLV
jgi:hypothetical protein